MRLAQRLWCVILIGCAALLGVMSAANAAEAMIPKAWLQQRVTVAQAEASHPGVKDERVKRFPDAAKPFGFRSRAWEDIKALMMPGDEIWTFSSPPESWENLAGQAGVALVRDGVPIRTVVTMMN